VFEKDSINKRDIKSSLLEIQVYDCLTLRKKLIGKLTLDLTKIYYNKDHTLLHYWVALTNPKENYSKVFG
jgi:hypothetical protein